MAPFTEGKIIYTPAHLKVTQIPLPVDLNHDGITDFKLSLLRKVGEGRCTTTSGIRDGAAFETTNATLRAYGVGSKNQVYGQGKLASALRAGVRVGPKGKFPGGNLMAHVCAIYGYDVGSSGDWAGSGAGVQRRFLGLKFVIHNKAHFGWARLNVTIAEGAVITATLTGYAYETVPNKPIVTGRKKASHGGQVSQVSSSSTPRPTHSLATLGNLAQGWPGLAARRSER